LKDIIRKSEKEKETSGDQGKWGKGKENPI
jgi:hypothetical protein